jgi:hypothetical protein
MRTVWNERSCAGAFSRSVDTAHPDNKSLILGGLADAGAVQDISRLIATVDPHRTHKTISPAAI